MAIIGFIALLLVLLYFVGVTLSITYISLCFESKAWPLPLAGFFFVAYLIYVLFQYAPFTIQML